MSIEHWHGNKDFIIIIIIIIIITQAGLCVMDAKTFHQICLSIVQLYSSLKSAKGTYMANNVWHTASSSLRSLLQSVFHLVILTY